MGSWADWIDVPRHTFSAVLGAVTASGRDNAETFQFFRPGFDVALERRLRDAAGHGEQIDDEDLYPDARPCLAALKDNGLRVGVAGNQTLRAAQLLRALDLPVDQIATSGEWGVAKPNVGFFERVIAMAPGRADQIVYVGDHRDNDIALAKAAGLRTVLIRRGPWGYLWANDPSVQQSADWIIDSLAELSALIATAD